MNAKIPTTVISGFPCIGKTTNAKIFPTIFRDLESSEYHWSKIVDAVYDGIEDSIKVPNPEWPRNYIEAIKALSVSGMYHTVMVSSHEDIRKAMKKAKIPYTNIYPEDTPEMKNLIMDRLRKRGSNEWFIKNLEKNYSKYVKSMADDLDATRRVALNPQTITEWGTWCAYA